MARARRFARLVGLGMLSVLMGAALAARTAACTRRLGGGPAQRRHPSAGSSVPRNRAVTRRHAPSRSQRHSAHSPACRAIWLSAPGILNLAQPPQVAPASRSKLALIS